MAEINFDPEFFPATRKFVFLLTEEFTFPLCFSTSFFALDLFIFISDPVKTNIIFWISDAEGKALCKQKSYSPIQDM